jgi:hypothetical protein
MKRHACTGGLLLLVCGCMSEDGSTMLPCNPFVTQAFKPAAVQHIVETPGTKEAADRVLTVGGKVVTANPQIGFRPRFCTIGSPKEEIIHRGNHDVFITEGLVRRCETDGQLAAVLCLELGKMVAERESLADPLTRMKPAYVPIDMPVGNDASGPFGSPDGTRRMELSKFEEQQRQKAEAPPPSPDSLARSYLRKAKFAPTDLDDIAAALRAADGNITLENTIGGPK